MNLSGKLVHVVSQPGTAVQQQERGASAADMPGDAAGIGFSHERDVSHIATIQPSAADTGAAGQGFAGRLATGTSRPG